MKVEHVLERKTDENLTSLEESADRRQEVRVCMVPDFFIVNKSQTNSVLGPVQTTLFQPHCDTKSSDPF